jgi:RND family efflux transporter MFP subunit
LTITIERQKEKIMRIMMIKPGSFATSGRTLGASILVLAGVWGCGAGAQAEDPQETDGYSRVINVEVAAVETERFSEVIRLTGTVQANQDVRVSAEETGVIREILVDKGRRVQAGEALFRLDDDLLSAQVDQALALSEMARETWERRKRLWEEDRVGSELVYLEAKHASEQARANLTLLEERLERTTIRAPISGVLDSREIEVGTMVPAGTPVARIVDTNPVKVTAGVPERYATDVRPGTEVSVGFDVLPGESFEGRISYVGSVVNPRNRTFPIELKLPNPGGLIKPEMVANVSVVRRVIEEAIVVPQEALVRVEDGYVAFVVRNVGESHEVASAKVRVGPAQQNRVVILEGLQAGDRLVVVGQQVVASGDRVNVVAER